MQSDLARLRTREQGRESRIGRLPAERGRAIYASHLGRILETQPNAVEARDLGAKLGRFLAHALLAPSRREHKQTCVLPS